MNRSLIGAPIVVAGIAASACSDTPLLPGCRANHECPSGWRCTAHTCEQTCNGSDECWGDGQHCIDGVCRYADPLPTPSCAEGAAFFVSPSGDDNWSGRKPQPDGGGDGPWRTVQKAADELMPGETVCVRSGIYHSFGIETSGQPDFPLTFTNYPGETPIIDGGTDDNITIVHRDGAENRIGWITIDGLGVANAADRGIAAYNAHHVGIRNCEIHNNDNTNIHIFGSHHITIENNILRNSGSDPNSHGISATGNYYTVANNVFFGNEHVGIHISAYNQDTSANLSEESGNALYWVIANNVFAYHSNSPGILIWDAEGTSARCEHFDIANNIFFHNGENHTWAPNGIIARIDGTNTVMDDIDIHHNIYFGDGSFIDADLGAGLNHYSNTNVDPRFIATDSAAYGGNDFHPQNDSIAINGGCEVFYVDSTNPIDRDFEYNRRPLNGIVDIGMYEVAIP